MSHALTVQDIKICFAPYDRVSGLQRQSFAILTPNDWGDHRHLLEIPKIVPIIHHILAKVHNRM